MGNVDQLAAKLAEIKGKGPLKVIIDMKAVDSFSSAGWGCLVEGQYNLKNAGGDLILSGMQEAQARVFELMGLEESFKTYPDAQAAMKFYQGGI